MKLILFLCALLFAPNLMSAQSFMIAVSPSNQTVAVGETVVYPVVITPVDGFNTTVFLTVSSPFNGTMTFSNPVASPPYTNITLKITPTYRDTGSKSFTITGKNGNVEATAVCSAIVPVNVQWIKIRAAQEENFDSSPITMKKDPNGDMCYMFGRDNNVYINHYRNNKWETETISTSIKFYYSPTTFVYDKNNILWFATPKGVARYDGKFTTMYNSSNSGIVKNDIANLDLDKNGFPICLGLGVNSKDGEALQRFDGTEWKSALLTAKLRSGSPVGICRNFCIDSLNNVWIASPTGEVIRIKDNDTLQEVVLPHGPSYNYVDGNKHIMKITCDKHGKIWCVYYHNIITGPPADESASYFDGTVWKHLPPVQTDATDFLIDDNDALWISSLRGLHKYQDNKWLTYNNNNSILPGWGQGDNESYIAQDKDKNIWVLVQNDRADFYVYNQIGLKNIAVTPLDVNEKITPEDNITTTPNPVASIVKVSGLESNASFIVVNSLGIVVNKGVSQNGECVIDVSELVSGVYFVQSHSQAGMISKPIIVNH